MMSHAGIVCEPTVMPRLIAIFFVLLLPAHASAQKQHTQPQQYVVECAAQFARTASHVDLVRRYGAKNVSYAIVDRDGETANATVLFAQDPQRRLDIEWYDESRRRLPSRIVVFGEQNQWIGPLGIRNGMTIEEIEKRAGKPFRINGFGFDVAGAGHFEETVLGKLPGGCAFGGYFEIMDGLPPDHLNRFIGEVEIDSNDPDLRSLKPILWSYSLTYPPQSTD